MKVTVENKEENKSKYPCLMKSTDSDTIILVTEEKGCLYKGFAVSQTNFGLYSDSWNKIVFQPFNGSITLSND